MVRFGLIVSSTVRQLAFAALVSLVIAVAGCGALRTELGDLVEPPGVPPTVPAVQASPATEKQAPGVPPTQIVKPEVTAESSAVPEPSPVVLRGEAGTSSTPLDLPPALHRAQISYTGDGPIKVTVTGEGREQGLLEAEAGYSGSVPLAGIPGGSLDTTAGGPWVIEIAGLGTQETPESAGVGDDVAGMFTAESTGPWRITHEGDGLFSAILRCIAGDVVVYDGSGPVDETLEVSIPKSWCYWVIKASGPWSLARAE